MIFTSSFPSRLISAIVRSRRYTRRGLQAAPVGPPHSRRPPDTRRSHSQLAVALLPASSSVARAHLCRSRSGQRSHASAAPSPSHAPTVALQHRRLRASAHLGHRGAALQQRRSVTALHTRSLLQRQRARLQPFRTVSGPAASPFSLSILIFPCHVQMSI
jgi:hypothetical protein